MNLNPSTGMPDRVRFDGVQSMPVAGRPTMHLLCFTDLTTGRSFSFTIDLYSEARMIERVEQIRSESLAAA